MTQREAVIQTLERLGGIATLLKKCQKEICKKITKKNCSDVLALKNNHKTMFEEIKEVFSGELQKSCQIF